MFARKKKQLQQISEGWKIARDNFQADFHVLRSCLQETVSYLFFNLPVFLLRKNR